MVEPNKEETQDPTAAAAAEKPPAEEKKETNNADLEYVFKADRDTWPPRPFEKVPPKPYPDDGNPDMYTPENIEKRDALRSHPNVKSGIETFMKRFTRSGTTKLCTKDEYVRVFVRVGQILRPGIDIDDLGKIIREDFDNDCREKKRPRQPVEGEELKEQDEEEEEAPRQMEQIDDDKLQEALFELADTWCPNIDDGEYKEFFEMLDRRFDNPYPNADGMDPLGGDVL